MKIHLKRIPLAKLNARPLSVLCNVILLLLSATFTSPVAAQTTATLNVSQNAPLQTSVLEIIGRESYESPVSFSAGPITRDEVFKLLADKAELNYVYRTDTFGKERHTGLTDGTLGRTFEALLSEAKLNMYSDGKGLVWLLPADGVKSSDPARTAARAEAQKLLGPNLFTNTISVARLPPSTKGGEVISLLASRGRIKINSASHAEAPLTIFVQNNTPGAILLALFECYNLTLSSDGDSSFTAEPLH